MAHLNHSELVAAAEGESLPDAPTVAHLGACARCRGRVEELVGSLAAARVEEPDEPSPLFWDHFAARVSEAVRDETPAPRTALLWSARPALGWVAILLIVVASATITWRATLHAPASHPGTAVRTMPAAEGTSGEEDVTWGAVRAAVDALPWDDVQAAGMVGGAGAADRAAAELTDAERAELARLLESEMTRGGA